MYTPNAQDGLARIDHRMAWDDAFRDFCKGLEAGVIPAGVPVQAQGAGEGHVCVAEPRTGADEVAHPKPVVMCGDFNVAHGGNRLEETPRRTAAMRAFPMRSAANSPTNRCGFCGYVPHVASRLEGAYSWWELSLQRAQEQCRLAH